ncbi:hypothetical protein FACS1894200_04370 [Spirochaetia bacterium]|nr:hypothetical protein FACS1894200_04370 [Spirochaetia bacterium]
MSMKVLFVVIMAALFAAGAFCQAPLSLEQARELALRNSRSLAKYNLSFQSTKLTEDTQWYGDLPSFSLGLSASTTIIRNDTTEDVFQTGPRTGISSGASFSISQKLFDGGRSSITKAINALTTEMARLDASSIYFSVLDSADAAFYAVLGAQASLESAQKSMDTAALSNAMAEIRYESKMLSLGDYLQAMAQNEAAATSLTQAKRNVSVARSQLANILGLTLKELPDLQAVDFTRYEPLLKTLSLFTDTQIDTVSTLLLQKATEKNPAFMKARLSSRIAQENVRLAKKDYMPTLNASVSTGVNYNAANGLERRAGTLSLSGSIPLDFWNTRVNVEKKELTAGQAALDVEDSVASLAIDIQSIILDLSTGASSVLSSRRALEYAEKHLEYVLELYRLSRNSLSELSDAEVLVSSNRRQFIQSQFSFLTNLSKMRSLLVFDNEDEFTSLLQ